MIMREKCNINGFKYPKRDKLSSRSSTICRSMACTLLERKKCSEEDEKKWKKFFPKKECAYCGNPATHLDHLYSLIENKEPTGYGTEPANLVPCCSKCNQPKGNNKYYDFMRSEKCKHITYNQEEIENRIKIIDEFQKSMPAHRTMFSEDFLDKWRTIRDGFDNLLKNAEEELLELK